MPNKGWQTQVYVQPAPGMPGDFASSTTHRHSVLFGPGGAVAGAKGIVVGNFAWASSQVIDQDNAPTIVNNFPAAGGGGAPPTGLVAREQQGLITQYLSNAGVLVPLGFACTLFNAGDFWVTNSGGINVIGNKAYANFADGSVTFAAVGTPTAGGVSTGSTVTAETFSITASVAGNVMTVTAVGSGVVYPGATLTGAASGTKVLAQLTSTEVGGTLGGRGTYAVSIPEQTVASGTITGTWGLLTITTLVSGSYNIGDLVAGGTVAANTHISMDASGSGPAAGTPLTGTGGAGTYAVDTNTAATAAAINVTAMNVETNFYAASIGGTGEPVKISSVAIGRTI